ncbi:MAG TPA: hypothetical protein VK174_05245, partial [Chitinophagales bacterium]|nr:hypothetical protein [Chitinophagales bacterium]
MVISIRIVFLAVLIVTSMAACKRMARPEPNVMPRENSVANGANDRLSISEKKRTEIEEEERRDSLHLKKTLEYVQEIASRKIAEGVVVFNNAVELPESDTAVR